MFDPVTYLHLFLASWAALGISAPLVRMRAEHLTVSYANEVTMRETYEHPPSTETMLYHRSERRHIKRWIMAGKILLALAVFPFTVLGSYIVLALLSETVMHVRGSGFVLAGLLTLGYIVRSMRRLKGTHLQIMPLR